MGKVLVDGEPAETGRKVTDANEIVCNGKLVSGKKVEPVVLAVNKPRGIVCTTAKFDGEENIVDFLNYPQRVYPVGRLDKNSEGLILMTNQGDLVNKILRGSNNHDKEYVVRVDRPITEEFVQKMENGVPILDTVTKPCKVIQMDKYKFRIVLTQGLNRQIRRMCEALGYHVRYLKRVRIMNIQLGDLPTGKYRKLTGGELKTLLKSLEGTSGLSYKDRRREE